jgi:polyferredoxin
VDEMDLKKHIITTLILLMSLMIFLPAPAYAVNSVLVGEYQIELFTSPGPLRSETEVTITLKVLRSQDNSPAKGGKILISTKETMNDIRTRGLVLKDLSGYEAAKEADEFGNYEFKTIFKKPETYYLKIAIKEIEGKRFNIPLKAGFAITVNSPKGINLGLLFIVLTIFIMTVTTLYIAHVRRKTISTDPKGFNLLDISWIKRLFQWKYIQHFFQIPLFVLFTILIILAFIDIQDGGRNLSTKIIWTIWWAGIIFTFVLVGRLWCFMCPVGALSDWVSRIFKPDRRFPSNLRNVWLANLMFLLLTWADIQLGVVRSPIVTGSILTGLTALAVLLALIYQRRVFCRHICPIGGLIGIYSMFSAVELRSNNLEVCRSHKSKDCYRGNEKGYGCPMFELTPAMDSNNCCNFCGECVKTCPNDNITIRLRTFFKDAWTTKKRYLDEATLAIVLVGVSIFVTGDMLGPWKGWIESAMEFVPAELLGIEYNYTLEVITKSILYFSVSLLLIPGMMLLASAFSNRMAGNGNHNGLIQTFITFGYMFIPIGLSMHLAHNTAHLLNESRGVVPAVQRTINKYTPFYSGEPNWLLAAEPLVNSTVVYWIQMVLFLIFYVFSLYAGYRLAMNYYKDSHIAFKALTPMIILSFVFMIINVYLLNLPMAPRHVH